MTGLFHSAWVQCKSIHGDSGSHSNAAGWPSPFPLQAECPESVHRCQNKVFLFWIQFARTEGCPPTHLTAKDHIEAKWLVFWCCLWQCNVPDFWSCYISDSRFGGTHLAFGGTHLAFGETHLAFGGTHLPFGGTHLAVHFAWTRTKVSCSFFFFHRGRGSACVQFGTQWGR